MRIKKHRIVEFMTPFPRTIDLDAPVNSAEELMREHRIRHLPVTEWGRIVGIISDRDLRAPIANGVAANAKVRSFMKDRPFCVDRNAGLDEVVAKMAQERIGSVIIIEENTPTGIFTTADACRALWEILQRVQNGWLSDQEQEAGP